MTPIKLNLQLKKKKFRLKKKNQSETLAPKPQTGKPIADFIPTGYKVFEEIKGDLNKDQRIV
nr:hypothetical protein [uncultured Flavobacterium sp.]